MCDMGRTNKGSCWEEQLKCALERGGRRCHSLPISMKSQNTQSHLAGSAVCRECIYELWRAIKQARTNARPFVGVYMHVFDTSKVASYVGRTTTAISSSDVRTSMSRSTTSVMRQEQLGCLLKQTRSTARPTWLCVMDVSTSNRTLRYTSLARTHRIIAH